MKAYDPENSAPASSTARFSPVRNPVLTVALGVLAAAIAGAAAATQSPGIVGLVGVFIGAATGIFLLRHRSILLWLLVLTTPFNEQLALKVGGLNFRPYTLLSVLGVVWIVWLFFTREKSRIKEIAWYYKGTIFLVVLLIISKLATVYTLTVFPPYMTPIFCVKTILFIGLQFAACFVVASFIESPERLQQVIRVWIHIMNLVFFVAFVQLVLANTMGMERLVWHREIIAIGRPYSLFREPDVLGCFYASSIAMLVPLVVANVKFVSRAYLIVTLLAQSFFLMLIVVRAAWIATVVCMMLYTVLMISTHRFRNLMPYLNVVIAAAMLGVVGVATAAPSVAQKIVERFVSVSNPKAESGSAYRIMEMKNQFDLAVHPRTNTGGPMTVIMGYGDFAWSYWAPVVIPEEDFDQNAKKLAKGTVMIDPGFSFFLAVQFDNGLVGLTLYCAFLLALTTHFLRTLRRTRDATRQALLIATFLPVVAVFVCYQFSYDPLYLIVWIMLGIHLATAYYVNRFESGIDEIGNPEPV